MALELVVLLLLAAIGCISAQPSPDSFGYQDPYSAKFSPGMAALIVVLLCLFFMLSFFSLYIRRRYGSDSSAISPVLPVNNAASSGVTTPKGLDPKLIETFPTMAYSEVKELRIGNEPLECAVCLSEFTEDESLRMLPRCCHVFHPACIDTWLADHVTCPVCRSDMSVVVQNEQAPCDDVAIDLSKIGRSHTTGHVLSAGGGVVDRFTLRLPEHVRREMVLRRSASVAAVQFPAGGEGSSRNGYRRGRSDRWGSLVRTLSTWRRGDQGGRSESMKGRASSMNGIQSNGQSSSSTLAMHAEV